MLVKPRVLESAHINSGVRFSGESVNSIPLSPNSKFLNISEFRERTSSVFQSYSGSALIPGIMILMPISSLRRLASVTRRLNTFAR